MPNPQIDEIKRIFLTRLDTLEHILRKGSESLPDKADLINQRLAPDMATLGAQVAFTCNQPLGFSQWCRGEPIQNLSTEVTSLEQALDYIRTTKQQVEAIAAPDSKLAEVKRIGMGPGRFAELPAPQYVNDFLMPNLYFHITAAYAILRALGAPLGKPDYMTFMAPHVQLEEKAG